MSFIVSLYTLDYYNDNSMDRMIREFNIQNSILLDDCNIYVKKDKDKLFANQIEYYGENDPDPMPKGNILIGYTGQGESFQLGYNDTHSYRVFLYVYDISKEFGFFDNEDDVISMLIEKYAETVQSCGYDYEKLDDVKLRGLSFCSPRLVDDVLFFDDEGAYVKKAQKVRSIFFANQMVYVLDVISSQQVTEHTWDILRSLTIKKSSKFNWQWLKRNTPLISLVIFYIVFLILQLKKHYRKSYQNKAAHIFFFYSAICSIVNLTILIVGYHNYFNISFYTLFGILLLFNLISVWIFNKKSETEYTSDFLVFKKVKQYMQKRTESESERKAVTAFVFYPFWVAGQLPFGLLILFYVIPLCLFILLGMEFRQLFRWIHGGTCTKEEHLGKTIFKDYYLILDLTYDATSLDIEKVFNQKMAHYYSVAESHQSKEQWLELQEAYKVLMSDKRLRPAYDKEYKIYDNMDYSSGYNFVDKRLERDILLIRKSLLLQSDNKNYKRSIKANIVFISFFIWLLSLFICFFLINDDSTVRSVRPERPERPERPDQYSCGQPFLSSGESRLQFGLRQSKS